MELVIISPQTRHSYSISWLEVNTPAGNFVIQLGHVPTVLTLSAHAEITFGLNTGKRESLTIKQGIAHITRTSATLLVSEKPY